MTNDSEIVTFTLLGQTFRIRVGHEQAIRARRVADGLTQRLTAEGAGVDLRSALMAAYGAAYELDEVTEALNAAKKAHQSKIESARSVMDRLLNQVDAELSQQVPANEPVEAAEEAKTPAFTVMDEPLVAEVMLEEEEVLPAAEPEPVEQMTAPLPDAFFTEPQLPEPPAQMPEEVTPVIEEPHDGDEEEHEARKASRKAHTTHKPASDVPDMFTMFAPPPDNFHEDPRSMEP
jgi:hypothetical protein